MRPPAKAREARFVDEGGALLIFSQIFYSEIFAQKPAYKNQGYPNSTSGTTFSFIFHVKLIRTLPKIGKTRGS